MTTKGKKTEKYSPTLDRMGQTQKRLARTITWEAASKDILFDLIVAVNDSGGGLLIGGTRDRGAWAITFFHDELPVKKLTEYCNSEEMLDDWLSKLVEIWRDVAAELQATKAE